MQYSEAKQGRIFILRLEDGEVVHETIEAFALEQKIQRAAVMFLGAAQKNSRMVSGPRSETIRPIPVNINILPNISEAFGVGTIFPDALGAPVLHMHASFGHKDKVLAGCIRAGVNTWNVGEVVIFELLDNNGARALDGHTGFELLTFED